MEGGKSGVEQYKSAGGATALTLINAIHSGITASAGTGTNALNAYVTYVMSQSACGNDISPDACNLYSQVYQPLEAYFQQAVAVQVQLAEAVVEAKTNLSQATGDASKVDTFMSGMRTHINDEAEAFLKAVEAIAACRAADGTSDWSSFGATDAAQALAQADFMVAQLAGDNYLVPLPPNYSNPPWPKQGVMGRIFYTLNEKPATSPREAYLLVDNQLSTPVVISEVTGNPYMMYGTTQFLWPYFQYSKGSDQGVVQALPTATWGVRRISPTTLPTGTYVVFSTNSRRSWGLEFLVATYDADYNNLSQDMIKDTDPSEIRVFGSLNGLEGPVGRYGLNNDLGAWVLCSTCSNSYHTISPSIGDQSHGVDGFILRVDYPDKQGSTGTRSKSASWDGTLRISFPKGSSDPWYNAFGGVKVTWQVPNANVQLALNSHKQGGECKCCLYNEWEVSLGLLDAKGNPAVDGGGKNPARKANKPCIATSTKDDMQAQFNGCTVACSGEDCTWGLNSQKVVITHDQTYSLKASFKDSLALWSNSSSSCYYERSAKSGSFHQEVFSYPTLRLTK